MRCLFVFIYFLAAIVQNLSSFSFTSIHLSCAIRGVKEELHYTIMGTHPDSNIHPVATGLAKTTVDKHSEEQPMKLYAGWFCPYVQCLFCS